MKSLNPHLVYITIFVLFSPTGTEVMVDQLLHLISTRQSIMMWLGRFLLSCIAPAACWEPSASGIPAVVKAQQGLASWFHNLSGYSIMSLYHKLVGAAGEETSGKG